MSILDTLEILERDATPGPVAASNVKGPGACDIVDEVGDWLAEFERAEDAAHYVAMRNAMPALLELARAVAEERDAAMAGDMARFSAAAKRKVEALAALSEIDT